MEECSVLIETTKSAEDKTSRWFDLPIDYELFRFRVSSVSQLHRRLCRLHGLQDKDIRIFQTVLSLLLHGVIGKLFLRVSIRRLQRWNLII